MALAAARTHLAFTNRAAAACPIEHPPARAVRALRGLQRSDRRLGHWGRDRLGRHGATADPTGAPWRVPRLALCAAELSASRRSQFWGASEFNADVRQWDMTANDEFQYMFSGAEQFNAGARATPHTHCRARALSGAAGLRIRRPVELGRRCSLLFRCKLRLQPAGHVRRRRCLQCRQ